MSRARLILFFVLAFGCATNVARARCDRAAFERRVARLGVERPWQDLTRKSLEDSWSEPLKKTGESGVLTLSSSNPAGFCDCCIEAMFVGRGGREVLQQVRVHLATRAPQEAVMFVRDVLRQWGATSTQIDQVPAPDGNQAVVEASILVPEDAVRRTDTSLKVVRVAVERYRGRWFGTVIADAAEWPSRP